MGVKSFTRCLHEFPIVSSFDFVNQRPSGSFSPQWKSVGEAVSVTLMWGDVPGFVYLPYALQHPRLTLGLSNLLQDNLYAKFGGKS